MSKESFNSEKDLESLENNSPSFKDEEETFPKNRSFHKFSENSNFSTTMPCK